MKESWHVWNGDCMFEGVMASRHCSMCEGALA